MNRSIERAEKQIKFTAALVYGQIEPWIPRLSLSTLPRLAVAAGGAGFLAASADASNVQAAAPECTISFAELYFEYFDHPLVLNRDGRMDAVDFVVNPTKQNGFGKAVLNIPAELGKPNSVDQRLEKTMVPKIDHAEAVWINESVKPNKKLGNRDAVEIWASIQDDTIRQDG